MFEVKDVAYLAEFVVRKVNTAIGTSIPDEVGYVIVGLPVAAGMIMPILFNIKKIRLAVRRMRGDPSALDDDGRAVVDHIRTDLNKLQQEVKAAAKRGRGRELEPVLELLSSRLAHTQQLVDGNGDNDNDDEIEFDRHGRIRRRVMIRLVRETILSNLWSGNYFDESISERHVFRTMFEDAKRKRITIVVRTPFAITDLQDELPYAIDIRHDTQMVMRIQWDPFDPDDIKIRYVIRGDWEQAILSWNVTQKFVPTSDLPADGTNPPPERESSVRHLKPVA